MQIPSVTTQQMIEVDRLMIEDYGIQLIQMMENAGKNLAELSRRILGGEVQRRRVAVLCGAGNNGGGGIVAARHLHNWGADVILQILSPLEKLKGVPAQQLHILREMGIEQQVIIDLTGVELILDAMIGYGIRGNPRENIAEWIGHANAAARPVLALDTPSGLNTNTGIPGDPCIRATATMTLALPKIGLLTPQASAYVGELYLADISVPPQLYARLGIEVPPVFTRETIIKL